MPSVQIRNVPERLHRELKARAAAAGMSLSDYLLAEIERVARPTLAEVLAPADSRPGGVSTEEIVAIIRAHRDAG